MGAHPTLLGCTVRRRFSIQRSRSARDVQPKERLPSPVMIWVQGRCQEGTPGCPGDGPGLGPASGSSGCLWLCWGALGAQRGSPGGLGRVPLMLWVPQEPGKELCWGALGAPPGCPGCMATISGHPGCLRHLRRVPWVPWVPPQAVWDSRAGCPGCSVLPLRGALGAPAASQGCPGCVAGTVTWKQNFSPTMLPCTGRMMTLSPVRSSSAALGGGSRDSREPLWLGVLRGHGCHQGPSPVSPPPSPPPPPGPYLSPSATAVVSVLGTARPFRSRSRFHSRPWFRDKGTDATRLPGCGVAPKGGAGPGMPTLTLLNWEVTEASLSVPFPAARVFLSSAAGSAEATHISPPLRCTPSPPTPR